MTLAYIALGANLGNPIITVKSAIADLDCIADSRRVATSSLYHTAPVGLKNQPDFINAVVALETGLAPQALLEQLFAIEFQFGRQRSVRNAPRTLDLDLLLYGDAVLDTPTLTLPHPRMHERAFVLAPLAEIAPRGVIPGRGVVADLLATCADQTIAKIPA
ncbi:MAG: 2-amino-4-hydroxy-6-hydroxymethyldihydropteridine diphosphokinase [Rhodocyclaceae bacterium]|nr:2-amino-4-hydroxy-6-hydroxymethyldihydropteridine diphosphokinase [Rhodocyclaceae bacterium]